MKAYRAFVASVIELIAKDAGVTLTNLEGDIQDMLDLEKAMAEVPCLFHIQGSSPRDV